MQKLSDWLRSIRWHWREFVIPKRWRFKCTECEDTGWASYEDRVGFMTYHVYDHCRKCAGRALLDTLAEKK
jgi:hypothetical protein